MTHRDLMCIFRDLLEAFQWSRMRGVRRMESRWLVSGLGTDANMVNGDSHYCVCKTCRTCEVNGLVISGNYWRGTILNLGAFDMKSDG